MSFEKLKAWLEEATGKRVQKYRLKGIVGCLLGPLAVLVAVGFVYGILMLLSHRARYRYGSPGLSGSTCAAIAVAIVPVLFVANRFVPRWDMVERRMRDPGTRIGQRAEAYAQITVWILFTGPRIFDWAAVSFRKARVLQQQDTHSCAAVLWVLATHVRKVPFTDIETAVPWLNFETALPEVLAIPGVLEFQAPPPGLGLTPELRQAICTGGAIEENPGVTLS